MPPMCTDLRTSRKYVTSVHRFRIRRHKRHQRLLNWEPQPKTSQNSTKLSTDFGDGFGGDSAISTGVDIGDVFGGRS